MDIREIPKIVKNFKNSEISQNSEVLKNFEYFRKSENFEKQNFERKKIILTPHLKQKMNHDVEMDIERIEFCQELLQEIIQQAVGKLFLFIK